MSEARRILSIRANALHALHAHKARRTGAEIDALVRAYHDRHGVPRELLRDLADEGRRAA